MEYPFKKIYLTNTPDSKENIVSKNIDTKNPRLKDS